MIDIPIMKMFSFMFMAGSLCLAFFIGVGVGESDNRQTIQFTANFSTIAPADDLDNYQFSYGYLTGVENTLKTLDNRVVWAPKGATSAAVYSDGPFYIEPEPGVKLVVKYMLARDGKIEHDIFAFVSDKEEIHGTKPYRPVHANTIDGSGSGR